VSIGDAGNSCDDLVGGCSGGVDYIYRISKTEVTNAQYAEFLNAKAAADPNELYDARMGNLADKGGIIQTGTSGNFVYSTIVDRQNMPVNWVTFYDSLRFVNWLNNGQGSGDTEAGSYTITENGILRNFITRNEEPDVVLPSEDEWYKAAFYDSAARGYFEYACGIERAARLRDPQQL
jgi:formylglycine-generating enzyme required for sulfatase activity